MRIRIPGHWTLRTLAGRSPAVFDTVFARSNDASRLVTRATDLVIEGFPRSGNSFTVYAMDETQKRRLEIAHHVHSPSQVIRAARYGIPAILLVRAPAAVVAAGLAKVRTHRAADLLVAYRLYYEGLLAWRRHVTIAPFGTVVSDFGRVIEAVNERFGTGFDVPDADRTTALGRRFLALEKFEGFASGGGTDRPHEGSETARLQHLLDRAERVHARYLALAAEEGTA